MIAFKDVNIFTDASGTSNFTDASGKSSGLNAGIAWVAVSNDLEIARQSKFIENITTTGAEIIAVVYAIDWTQKVGIHDFILHTDSKLVFDVLSGLINLWEKQAFQNMYDKTDRVDKKELAILYERYLLVKDSMAVSLVKGHGGSKWNSVVDNAAMNARKLKLSGKIVYKR